MLLKEFPINARHDAGICLRHPPRPVSGSARTPRLQLRVRFRGDEQADFLGQYTRIASYFDGTELASTGLPGGRELEILEAVRAKVPPEVFTTPYTNPVGGSPEAVRDNLRKAFRSSEPDTKYATSGSSTARPASLSWWNCSPRIQLERPSVYKPSLDRLGITVSVRTVDNAQYQNRLRSWTSTSSP